MSNPEQYEESIRAAVEREAKRRRRVLTGYLALLIVSMAVGGFAVVKAPTETEIVAKKVEPIVRDQVRASVADDITRSVVQSTGPQIDAKVSSAFAEVKPRFDQITGGLQRSVQTINQNVTRIETTVRTSSQFIDTARPQLAQIEELRGKVDETNRSMNETFAKSADVQQLIEKERAALHAEVQGLIGKEREALRSEMQRLIDQERAALRREMQVLVQKELPALRNEVRTLVADEHSRTREALLKEAREEVAGEWRQIHELINDLTNRVDAIEIRLKMKRPSTGEK